MNLLKEFAVELVDAARDAGATDAVAEVTDSTVNQIRFSSKRVDTSNWWNEVHGEVFVAVGKRTLSSDIRDMGNARRQVEELVQLARKSPESKKYGGIASGRFKYSRRQADSAIMRLKDPSRYVHEAIAAADPDRMIDIGGTLFVRKVLRALCSTGGAFAYDECASIELSVRAFSQPEASGHALCCSPKLSGLKAKQTGMRAAELAESAKNPIQGEEGKTDLIVEPLMLGGLMNSTSMMLSALRVEIGTSIFAKKIGKQVASKEVTLMDDPTMLSTSMRSFDHEGAPTRVNTMIKEGVLRTYLHNTSTAKRFKTKTTANAGPLVPTLWTMPTQPVPFHPVLRAGDWDVDEMIQDTRRGLYLNNTWYTRYQSYQAGDFSTIPRDAILRIEDGEIVGSVKNVRVSDNMLNFWKSVDAVSKRQDEIFWWDEASPPSTLPFIRARAMTITRSA